MHEWVVESFKSTGDIKMSTDKIVGKFMDSAPRDVMPLWVVKLVVGSMVYQASRSVSKV